MLRGLTLLKLISFYPSREFAAEPATVTIHGWRTTGSTNMDKLAPMLIAAWLLGSQAATAQAEAADTCRTIDSPAERLACYDRLHGRAQSERDDVEPPRAPPAPAEEHAASAPAVRDPRPTSSPTPPAAPAAPAAPVAPANEAFGEEQLPSRAAPAEQAELETIVLATGRSMTGRHWYRLEGGQLWEQVTPRHTGIDEGDAIRISRSPLGTYHIRRADGSSRSSQVRRRE
jgi:hypothetical protein